MISLELIFLPAILLLGIITSYQDFKFGKIKNKWIILALSYFIIVYALGIFFYTFYGELNVEYIIELSTNILFAIFIGFGLWYLKVWTAGDGKLFIAYSVLIPLSVYSLGYQKYIPCSVLLINIFILAFMVLFFSMVFKIKFKNLKKVSLNSLKESFELKQVLFLIINLFAIFWVIGILLSLVNLNNPLLKISLTMLIFLSIPKKYKNKSIYFLSGFVILRLIIDKSVYSWTFLINFIVLIFLGLFIRSFLLKGVNQLGQEIFSKEISVNKLKPGMILSEVIIKKDKKELKSLQKNKDTKIIKYKEHCYIQQPKSLLNFEGFIDEESEGLTKEQINLIKKIGIKTIKISQTIPFALFMFAGVLLTFIIKGNFLSFLKGIF